MIYANYHTHTMRCNHAQGTEDEYVEAAIASGMKILGFSDHTPYFALPREHYSGFRMKPEQAEDYFNSVLRVRDKYKDKITIYAGVEAEFYPKYFGDLLDNFRRFPIQYMILGQHFLDNEIGSTYAYTRTTDEVLLEKFVKQMIRAIDTGAFSYVAHPDLMEFDGDEKIYAKHYRKLCEHCLEKDMALELNLLGLGGGRHYPNEKFFKIVGEMGNKVIIGCDAHSPAMLSPGKTLDRAMDMADKFKLNLIDTIELKDPKKIYFEEE
ncbi:MAG: histidinol-phosphatase [Clostridia bacterium]|nr:histidinol-phosphatase [Clostridia bacterium]